MIVGEWNERNNEWMNLMQEVAYFGWMRYVATKRC